MKSTLDLSNRLLGRDQEAQYRAAVRLRDDVEHRFHALDILQRAYTCQGIYKPRQRFQSGARSTGASEKWSSGRAEGCRDARQRRSAPLHDAFGVSSGMA